MVVGPRWRTARSFEQCQYEVSVVQDSDAWLVQLLSPTTGRIFLSPDDVERLTTCLRGQPSRVYRVLVLDTGFLAIQVSDVYETGFGPLQDPTWLFSEVTMWWLDRQDVADAFTDVVNSCVCDDDVNALLRRKNGDVTLVNSARHDPDGPGEVFDWLTRVAEYARWRDGGTNEGDADIEFALTYGSTVQESRTSNVSWTPSWSQ